MPSAVQNPRPHIPPLYVDENNSLDRFKLITDTWIDLMQSRRRHTLSQHLGNNIYHNTFHPTQSKHGNNILDHGSLAWTLSSMQSVVPQDHQKDSGRLSDLVHRIGKLSDIELLLKRPSIFRGHSHCRLALALATTARLQKNGNRGQLAILQGIDLAQPHRLGHDETAEVVVRGLCLLVVNSTDQHPQTTTADVPRKGPSGLTLQAQ